MRALDESIDWSARFARRTGLFAGSLTAILATASGSDLITFSGGFPAPETFPTAEYAALAERLICDEPGVALQYATSEGLPGFREVLSQRVGADSGFEPEDGQLMVTSGGIDAVALLGRVLLDAGDLVLAENPTYLGAITGFWGYEAMVGGVEMDSEGLDPDALRAALSAGPVPKILYTIPDYQNPSGLTLGAERRSAVIEVCREFGVLILEDVAYRQLGQEETPLPSLYSMAPELVVQIGTFSKTLFPGVRLGWAVGPQQVIEAMVTAKQNSDQCSGALGQRLCEEHLRSGGFDRQLPVSRALYSKRRAAMLSVLDDLAPEGCSWTRPEGGFFVWLALPEGCDAVAMADRAKEAGVAYVPGAPFCIPTDGGLNMIRLSYSRATEEEIAKGMAILCDVIRAEIKAA